MFDTTLVNIVQHHPAKACCVLPVDLDVAGVYLPMALAANGDGVHLMVLTTILALDYPMHIKKLVAGLGTEVAPPINKLLDLLPCLALPHYQL